MPEKKVALALGGGAARGMAHIGVLEVLQEEGIPLHLIAGTSAGAAIGALFAAGKSIPFIRDTALQTNWRRVFPVMDLALAKTGLHTGRRFTDWLKLHFGGDLRFDELKLPFACVATDIMTGEEVVLQQGSVAEAIRASSSIPGLFTVVKWQDRYLVDGQLVNPGPVSVARGMGADFVIAVNVIPDIYAAHKEEKPREPTLMTVVTQSFGISGHALVVVCLAGADVVIQPRLDAVGAGDFSHAAEAIEQGRLAAREALPQIKNQLRLAVAPAPSSQ